jgi:predicted transcriptional regulator of viral defense system
VPYPPGRCIGRGALPTHMGGKSATPPVNRRIALLAQSQHGVVSLGQLRSLGVGHRAVEGRLRSGRLHQVHRGVYAVGHPLLSSEGRWTAAVLACGPGAVLSHRTAAAHWGLRPAATATVEMTVPTTNGRRRRRGIVIHRSRSLGPSEVTIHQGIPVTTPARALLDTAELVPRHQLERAVERAETLRIFDLTALRRVITENPTRRGSRLLAEVLDAYGHEPGFTRSDLEQLLLRLCVEHGLPRPLVNTVVGRYEPDFLWRDQRLIVETDGHETHGTRAAFERDRARDAQLVAEGYRVVRFTYRQMTRRPQHVAEVLRSLLN